jgi:hypothetical protein
MLFLGFGHVGTVLCQEAGAGALGVRDDPGAIMCQEMGAGATGHVAILELSCALVVGAGVTRHVVALEPRDTQTYASVLSFIFNLELVHWGTQF